MKQSTGKTLFADAALHDAVEALVNQVVSAGAQLRPGPATLPDRGHQAGARVAEARGRPLYFDDLVGSGLGRGALVETIDGAVRYDFITGIGVHFFGHSDADLLRTAVTAALQDVVQQGNLQPNEEYADLLARLIELAPERLTRGWLATSGADANENALKVCRAARHPAYKIVAFEGCFAGRTTTMAEITDNPAYRAGQHLHGDVLYVPFYDPRDAGSVHKSISRLEEHLHRYEGQICAFMFELIQGEGGFNAGPPAFFEALMKKCQEHNVLVWVDEIQTFGRTTEMFATHALALDELVDLITVGKLLQDAATLYTDALNPPAGLLSGTFSGTTVGLAVGRRILDRLADGAYGPDGRHAAIERVVLDKLTDLSESTCKGRIAAFGAIGTMAWVMPLGGKKDQVHAVIRAAYERGVITFVTGHGPYRIRMLLPGGVVTDEEVVDALDRLGEAINEVGA